MCARLTIVLGVLIGGFATPVGAIEMFTNFNNGTELGTRPYGIEVLSPVRYHAYPHGRWFQGSSAPCGVSGGAAANSANMLKAESNGSKPAVQMAPATVDRSMIVKPTESTARRGASAAEEQWIRSSNFLPPAQAE